MDPDKSAQKPSCAPSGFVDKRESSEPSLTSFNPDPREGLPSECTGNQNEHLQLSFLSSSWFGHLRL